jgi:hypothetical protein
MNGVLIRFNPTNKNHLVEASGNASDGSLYNFRTYCGQWITKIDRWTELEEGDPSCKQCIRLRPYVNRRRRLDIIALRKHCAEMKRGIVNRYKEMKR